MDEDLAQLKRALDAAGSAIVGVSRETLLRLLAALEQQKPASKDQPRADLP